MEEREDSSGRPDAIEAPEADALEQSQDWEVEEEAERPRIDVDVPEADALEQNQPVPLDEDEDYR